MTDHSDLGDQTRVYAPTTYQRTFTQAIPHAAIRPTPARNWALWGPLVALGMLFAGVAIWAGGGV